MPPCENRALHPVLPYAEGGRFREECIEQGLASESLPAEAADAPSDLRDRETWVEEWRDTSHALAGVNCSGCHATETSSWVDVPARETCAGCHEGAWTAWRRSHHRAAMQPASEATVLGAFPATVEHRGVTSRFFRRDGGFFVETEGVGGRRAEFEIAYTFGVEPLQQLLVEFPKGRLQALPLAWDNTIPPGTQFTTQWWCQDATAPAGASGSNGLRMDLP